MEMSVQSILRGVPALRVLRRVSDRRLLESSTSRQALFATLTRNATARNNLKMWITRSAGEDGVVAEEPAPDAAPSSGKPKNPFAELGVDDRLLVRADRGVHDGVNY